MVKRPQSLLPVCCLMLGHVMVIISLELYNSHAIGWFSSLVVRPVYVESNTLIYPARHPTLLWQVQWFPTKFTIWTNGPHGVPMNWQLISCPGKTCVKQLWFAVDVQLQNHQQGLLLQSVAVRRFRLHHDRFPTSLNLAPRK